nr:MAG: hypothetical protein [Sclerotinia sclerotiorum fusarivirus 2]
MEKSNSKVQETPSGSRVEQIMESAHKRSFSAGGQKGFFVGTDDLAYLEKLAIERKDMKNHVLLTDDEVARLREETAKLKHADSLANQRMQELQNQIDATFQKLERAESERATAKSEADQARENKKAMKDELIASKAEWEQHVKRLENLVVSKDLSDPVDLKTTKDELTIARRNVKSAQTELERLNREVTVANEAVSNLTRLSENLKSQYDESMSNYDTIHAAWKAAQKANPPPEVINVLANIKLDSSVKKLVGEKSYEWLEKLKEVPAVNVRDTTFHLLGAARESSNKQVSKLTALLQWVFDWVKKNSNKVRLQLKPWLDTIAKDIATGKVRTMAFYREELEKLVVEFKATKAKAVKQLESAGKTASFTTDAVSWIKVLFYYRPKRYFAKGVGFVKAGLSKTMKSIKKVLSGIASYFSFTNGHKKLSDEQVESEIHMFDAEVLEKDLDVGEGRAPPPSRPQSPAPPPPPPPPKGKTKIQLMAERTFGKGRT